MDAMCREVKIVRDLLEATRTAVRRQRASLEATQTLYDVLEGVLDDLLDASGDDSLAGVVRELDPKPGEPKDSRAEQQANARIGISKISLVWREDGWATVTVQDFATLTLAPAVGALLEQLIAVREVGEDGFPVPVSKDTLRRTLGVAIPSRRARRPEQAVDQLVYRLREEFEHAHLNRWFIDTKSGGVRLLLRRSRGDAETAAAHRVAASGRPGRHVDEG